MPGLRAPASCSVMLRVLVHVVSEEGEKKKKKERLKEKEKKEGNKK
jgi:hypothetical protein